MNVTLQLQNVSKQFGAGPRAVCALRDVSLAIPAGTMAVVAGPSGSGKTTLLNIAGALETPDTGSVEVAGLDLTRQGERALSRYRRAQVGFIFQRFNLLSDLTVRENLELPLVLNRVDAAERRRRLTEVLVRLGVSGRAGAFPNELSVGEEQRVAVGRAVVHRPALLLADEPTANLDSVNARHVVALLDELHRMEKVTVLVATHDPQVVAMIGVRIFLRDGAIERLEGLSDPPPSPPS